MDEAHMGLHSIFHIVATGKTHKTSNNSSYCDVNAKAVFGKSLEIITDIYPHWNTLKYATTNNNITCDTSKFDTAAGEIINIIISYNIGWSKRENGHSYDSLNGYGTIIGFLSGKILDSATRNQKCRLCDLGHTNDTHKCRKNFAVVASSQGNESLNNIMVHKAPKNNRYCLSESADFILASAVASKNNVDSYIMEKSSQNNNASSEGVQYKLNCTMEIDSGFNNISSNLTSLNNVILCVADECSIVYFDLETSGFQRNANILQIAAKSENTIFNVYVTPTKPVDVSASKITGLQNIRGRSFVYDKEIHKLSITEALVSFYNFQFPNALIGFTNTLNLFMKNLPERKGRNIFKLESPAQDILQINSAKFHDATYDVKILNELFCLRKVITLPSLRVLEGSISNTTIQKLVTSGISYNKLSKVYEEFGHKRITDLL
ncbi:hypothetical protein PV327_010115 [Microctonus hyperodae]|uniref:Mutator-like transposase domain-containing protein n=1 Tax=Microctonus hyperodae TaxID=165561 RepID=A0AA39FRQ8_MICHY|nr:hypothetical protein PV327_010115 [Microctonus hyperodae]